HSRHFLFISPISLHLFLFFFFNATAPTEIYTLSLHDALPISSWPAACRPACYWSAASCWATRHTWPNWASIRSTPHTATGTGCRSEEHTSELQSRENLVCRLLLEKKKKKNKDTRESSTKKKDI